MEKFESVATPRLLYDFIQRNNQAYQVFVKKWLAYGKNTGTGTQFSNHYSSLRPTQNALT